MHPATLSIFVLKGILLCLLWVFPVFGQNPEAYFTALNAKQDRTSIACDGVTPNKLACDATLRVMPDTFWAMVMHGGGDKEPDPKNQVILNRSYDEGRTRTPMQPLEFVFSREGDTVALLHNPNSKHRSPMALWISFDGMKTWPYQRVLQQTSNDGPRFTLSYPDGIVSKDKQWLHFAFNEGRHRAVHYNVNLPPHQ